MTIVRLVSDEVELDGKPVEVHDYQGDRALVSLVDTPRLGFWWPTCKLAVEKSCEMPAINARMP